MKAGLTMDASKRFCLVIMLLFGCPIIINGQAEVERREEESQELENNLADEEEFYEWSVWSPCSRTCGIGIQFRGQLCLRENKALCVEKPIIYQTCNTQACLPGGESFRDVQCGMFNGRDIFINGHRAKWMSYIRGDNQCLLFCYPYGGELFYYFGKAKDGTQCSKEPHGVCLRGRCTPVGCDNVLESGVYLDKCRVCGGNSTTCEPVSGRIERSPTQFEKMSGYAEVMVIPKGSTSVFLSDETWNYLAIKRQNGEYVVNGHRIVNWSGLYKVGDVDVQYKRLSDNIKETIQISGPTKEDFYVTSLLITGKLNTSFEYWEPLRDKEVSQDAPTVGSFSQDDNLDSLMDWGSWTACSVTCGGGIQVRARQRGDRAVSSFRERETDVQRCNVVPCDKMTAKWSEWGPWDDCSASCGGGARMRFRYCKKPSSSAVKSGCPGERYAVELCNVHECPKEETSLITSEMKRNETSSSSSLIVFMRESTATSGKIHSIFLITPGEMISDSYKATRTASSPFSVSTASSPSHLMFSIQYQYSSFSSKQEVRKEKATVRLIGNVSRSVEDLFPFPSQNTLKESKTTYESKVLTTKEELTPIESRKSQGIGARSSDHYQRNPQSSLIKKHNMSTTHVKQRMVTRASVQRSHTSTEIPAVADWTRISTMQATVTTIPIVRPSPVSNNRLITTKQLAFPTHPSELVPSLKTDGRTRTYVPTPGTSVIDSGSERSSQVIASERRTFLSLVNESITPQERMGLELSSRLSTERPLSAKYSVFHSNDTSIHIPELADTASEVISTSSHAILERTSVISSTLHEADILNTTSISDGLHSTLNPSKMSLFVTNVSVATPFSILDKAASIYSSSIGTTEQNSSTVSLQNGSSASSIDSEQSFISTTVGEFRTTETVKGQTSSRLTMTRGSRMPSSQARKTLEQSSVQLKRDFLLGTTNYTLPPNKTLIKHLQLQTSAPVGTKSLGINITESGHPMLKKATRSLGLPPSMITIDHLKTLEDFTSVKTEMEEKRKRTDFAGNEVGWLPTVRLSFTQDKSTKYVQTAVVHTEEVDSARKISERFKTATGTRESVPATKTTLPLETITVTGVSRSITSIGSVNIHHLKSSQSYGLSSNVNKGSHEIKSNLTISSALPLGVKRVPMYPLASSSSWEPSSTLILALGTSKRVSTVPLAESNSLLPSSSIFQTSTITENDRHYITSSSPQLPSSTRKHEATASHLITSSSSGQPKSSSMKAKETSELHSNNSLLTLRSFQSAVTIQGGPLPHRKSSLSVFLNQWTLSSSSPQFSSVLKEANSDHMQSATISSSRPHMPSSMSSQSRLLQKEEAMTTRTEFSTHSSLRQPVPSSLLSNVRSALKPGAISSQMSMSLQVTEIANVTTRQMQLTTNPSLRQPIQSSDMSQISSAVKEEASSTLRESITGLWSREHILFSSLQDLNTLSSSSSRQHTSSKSPPLSSASDKRMTSQMQSSSYMPRVSSATKDEDMFTFRESVTDLRSRGNILSLSLPYTDTLLIPSSRQHTPSMSLALSAASDELMISHMQSLSFSSSGQSAQLLMTAQSSSAMTREAITGDSFSITSSARRLTSSSMSVQYTSERRLTSSSMSVQYTSPLTKETITKHIESALSSPFSQSSMSPYSNFSSNKVANTKNMDFLTGLLSHLPLSLSWQPKRSSVYPHLGPTIKQEATISHYEDSFARLSATPLMLSSTPQRYYPTPKKETISKHTLRSEMAARAFTTEAESVASSPSRQRMMASPSSQLSLERKRKTVPTLMLSPTISSSSQLTFSTISLQLRSKQQGEPMTKHLDSILSLSSMNSISSSFSPHFALNVEAIIRREETFTSLWPRQPMQTLTEKALTSRMDSSTRRLMQSSILPKSIHFSSVPKEASATFQNSAVTTRHNGSLASPSLTSPTQLSIPLHFNSPLREALASSLGLRMTTSMPAKFSSVLMEDAMTRLPNFVENPSSKQPIISSLTPHLSLAMHYEETLTTQMVSITSSSPTIGYVSLTKKGSLASMSRAMKEEGITSHTDFLPSSRETMQSSMLVEFTFALKQGTVTSRFDLTSSYLSRKPKIPSITKKFSPSPNASVTMASHVYSKSTTPLIQPKLSSVSPNLNSTAKKAITGQMFLATSLSSPISSIITPLSTVMMEEAMTTAMDSFTSSSLLQLLPSSVYTHLIFPKEQGMNTRKDYLTSSLSTQPTSFSVSPSFRSEIEENAMSSQMARSSSRQAMILSSFAHLKKALSDDASVSHINSLVSSSARISTSPSFSSHFSSVRKEAMDSQQPMHSPISSHFTSAPKGLMTTSIRSLASSMMFAQLRSAMKEETMSQNVDSLTTSSLAQPISSSISPHFGPAMNSEANSRHAISMTRLASISSTLPHFTSSLQEGSISNHMDSFAASLSRLSTISIMPALKEETMSSRTDSLATLHSRQPTPSLTSSYLSSPLNEKSFTSFANVLPWTSPKQPMLSSISSHLSSALDSQMYSATRLSSKRLNPSSISSEFSITSKDELMTDDLYSVKGLSLLSLNTSSLPSTSVLVSVLRTPISIDASSSMGLSSITQQTSTKTVQTLTRPSSPLEGEKRTFLTPNVKPTTVNETAASAPTTTLEERSSQCPPCDLSQRLKEKYCYSDYAVLVRIRSEAIINGSQTAHFVKVKNVFKKNQPMKVKLEIRFYNRGCNCKVALLLKRHYLVFGKHMPTKGTISFLEVDSQSFVAEWDVTLENETKQMKDYCSRNSVVPTPRLAPSLQFTKTKTATTATSQISTLIESPATSSDKREASTRHLTMTADTTTTLSAVATSVTNRCDPCKNGIKRTRAYCTSDFVVHVKIVSEAINELSLDTNYRVRLIHVFKMTSSLATFRSVWILSNLCRCPVLLPGKHYLLMGQLSTRVGSTKTIAEVSRESYVEEWKGSMVRRMPLLGKKRCPVMKTTQMPTLVRTEPGSTAGPTEKTIPSTTDTRSEEIAEVTSAPPTSSSTSKPPVKCRRCRISKKRNRSYCESDFVIRARILQSTFDGATQERKYLVNIKTAFRNLVELRERQEIIIKNDYCQCPNLSLQEEYVIMGTAERISVTEIRLLIPQRPFVRIWQANMEAKFKSIGEICDN